MHEPTKSLIALFYTATSPFHKARPTFNNPSVVQFVSAAMGSMEELKAKGNAAFAEGNWVEARELYTQALDQDRRDAPSLTATVLSNRSATWAMLEDYEAALRDAESVLQLRPEWSRGYARKGVALMGLKGTMDEVVEIVKEGRRLAPDDTMLKELETHITEEIQRTDLKRKSPEGITFGEALKKIRESGVEGCVSVVVLSGFLGAGKTTLLNRILKENAGRRRIAVLVNDMAEINIDADLVRHDHAFSQTTEELVELTDGCVCCTLRGDLIKEATQLLCMKLFDVLLIEATGISEPMPVAATFTSEDFHGASLKDYFKIDNMVTLVDGVQFFDELGRGTLLREKEMQADAEDQRTISQLLIDQVEFADTVLVNKCDLISQDAVDKIRQLLMHINPTAKILNTVRTDVDLTEILDTGRFRLDRAQAFDGFTTEMTSPHVPETDEYGIGSIVFSSRVPFHPVRLHRFFFGEEKNVNESRVSESSVLRHAYRSKGFFYLASDLNSKLVSSTAGRSVSFEIAERWLASMLPEHLWPQNDDQWDPTFGDREQKIVIIAEASHLRNIRQILHTCLLTPDELHQGETFWSTMDPNHLWQLDPDSDTDSGNSSEH